MTAKGLGQEKIWDYLQIERIDSFSRSCGRLEVPGATPAARPRVLNVGGGSGIFNSLGICR